MQRDNPSAFFSFVSKLIFIGLIGQAAFSLVGALVVLVVLILRLTITEIQARIEDKDVWNLQQERTNKMRELTKITNSSKSRGEFLQNLGEIREREQEIADLTERIKEIKLQRQTMTR